MLEDAHEEIFKVYKDSVVAVLILVVLEDAHEVELIDATKGEDYVLILVVLEDAHEATGVVLGEKNGRPCLNPCCVGRCSRSTKQQSLYCVSLNPCCVGRCSRSKNMKKETILVWVS